MTAAERQIRTLVYKLKRAYSKFVDLYYQGSESVDYATGVKTVSKSKWTIKAVFLPPSVKDVRLPGFPGGGDIKVADAILIVDLRDLPSDLELNDEMYYFIIDSKRYELLKAIRYMDSAMVIALNAIQGAPLNRFVEGGLQSGVSVESQLP